MCVARQTNRIMADMESQLSLSCENYFIKYEFFMLIEMCDNISGLKVWNRAIINVELKKVMIWSTAHREWKTELRDYLYSPQSDTFTIG